ncbi:MAG TPA: oxidoreductase [Acidobacteriota bacterium]|nr:oxidoreductase [Acidobacteriota bacterium]
MSKPKIGFYWCASCGGCEEAVVDLAEDILKVVEAVDIVFWPVALDIKKSDVEAMADGAIAACFINGAIRTSEQEEMAHLLRRKSQAVIAFGSCAHTGGIPGLANLYEREALLRRVYDESPSTVNEAGTRPQLETEVPGGVLTLPEFYDSVKTLAQTIDVDYYLPGCPPPVKLIVEAVTALLEGKLPAKGSVLAPNIAMCDECPRKESKPEKVLVTEFKRPHQIIADPEKCLLDQGLLCMGPVTRSGCGAACVSGNMPCTGCMGPTEGIQDYGGKALSTFASCATAIEEDDVSKVMDGIVDPAGTFYRYSLPASFLHRRVRHNGNGGSRP